jgi:hypothetical protein
MRKLNQILAGAAIATMGIGLLPATAQAQAVAPASPAGVSVQADGNLHLYRDVNYGNYCRGYVGNSTDWGTCRNQVSSLWNNGYPGDLDDVWLYWGTNYSGARRGVHNGVSIADLQPYTFDAGTGTGAGQSINNNVSSHKWTNL